MSGDESGDEGDLLEVTESYMNATRVPSVDLTYDPSIDSEFADVPLVSGETHTSKQASTAPEHKGKYQHAHTTGAEEMPIGERLELSPFETAGLLSRTLYLYVVPLLQLGWRKPLEATDMPPLAQHDKVKRVTNILEVAWEHEVEKHVAKLVAQGVDPEVALRTPLSRWSMWRAVITAHWREVKWAAFYSFWESSMFIVQPMVLRYFVRWLANDSAGVGEGVGLAFAMVAGSLLQSIGHHNLYFMTMRMGWNVRTGFIGMVHNKLLRLTGAPSTGRVISLVSSDVNRFDAFMPAMHFLWLGLLDVLIVTTLICWQIGIPSGLAGIAVMFLVMFVQFRFGTYFARRRRATAAQTDLRVRTTSEVLSGILSVKAFCWEQPFIQELADIRKREANCIRMSQAMKGINDAMFIFAPTLSLFVIFSVKWGLNEHLELPSVLSVIALVAVLRTSVGRKVMRFFESAPEAHVAVRRLQRFMELPERSKKDMPPCLDPENVLEIKGANFFWSSERESDTKENNGNKSKGEGKAIAKNEGESKKKCTFEQKENGSGSHQAANTNGATQGTHSNGNSAQAHKGLDAIPDSQATSSAVGAMNEILALANVNVSLRRGRLLMVAGSVGSGKSALLQAILGELSCKQGQVRVSGTMAYTPQSPWIMAGSLRENILFGSEYDEVRYRDTLRACALLTDIEQLPDGERTEIGEKGVNLSGGQKARVALARSYYGDFDLVLLDDPLSAVDPHVAEHLYEHAVMGLVRRGAAVILVTHHPHFFRSADEIALVRDGKIIALGDMKYLLSEHRKELEEMSLLSDAADESAPETNPAGDSRKGDTDSSSNAKDGAAKPAESKTSDKKDDEKRPNKLVLQEDRKVGVVSWSTYKAYISSGGTLFAVFVLFLFLSVQALIIAADNWLKAFANKTPSRQSESVNVYGYGCLAASTIIVALLSTHCFHTITRRAATRLHTMAISRVLSAPMSFFTANPHGRILNRFSADQGQVDEQLAPAIFETVQRSTMALGSIIFACIAVPYTIIFIPILGYYMIKVRQYATKSLRELKRLDGTSRSPVYAAFSATLNGLVSIRAFGRKEATQSHFLDLLETNAKTWFSWLLVNRWLGLRLDMMCTALVTSTAFLGVILRNTVSPGVLGLALMYTAALSGVFQYMIRQSALVETFITSVERLLHYGRDIPVEKDPELTEEERRSLAELSPEWPQQGAIEAKNLFVKYREDLPLVLRDASFSIKSGFKVGIVGRTGSGKSSLVQALFRLNDIVSGKILVDGFDTGLLPLNRLRSSMGLIPQSPHLFQGTLRYNLDPFGRFSDKELWDALESVQLKGAVEGLEMHVEEHGRNFSAGQRQLLSLARAMLGQKRIIVMDEATANVDYVTDALIQNTLRNSDCFKNATVLVIAHRIKTIEDSDLILVLDNGSVVEAGHPEELLKNPNGIYFALRQKSLEEAQEVQKV